MKLSTEIFDGLLGFLFKDKRVAVIVTFFLVFYGGAAGPKLPKFLIELFESPIFRIFILSLIVYKGNSNPMLAIMVAVGFTLTMDMINKQKLFEKFTSMENFEGIYKDGYETFADHDDDLPEGDNIVSDDMADAISGTVNKPKFNEEELKANLVTYSFLSENQAQAVIDNAKGKLETQGTLVLEEDEISGILDSDNYKASDELDLGSIISQLQNIMIENSVEESSLTMSMDDPVMDEEDPLEDEMMIIDDDMVSTMGI